MSELSMKEILRLTASDGCDSEGRETMTDSDRIRKALTGDEGHAVRTCGTCYNGRAVEHYDADNPKKRIVDCPDCNGTGVIEDRERIARVVSSRTSVYPCGNDMLSVSVQVTNPHGCLQWSTAVKLPCPDKSNPGLWDRLWIWDNRSGQPWQDRLERHVRDWREPAPDYSTAEGMPLLKVMLREAGYRIDLSLEHGICQAWVMIGASIKGHGKPADTENSALYSAVLAAIGGSDDS